jgi:uncharacterized protein (TIGR02453 family)
MHSKPDPEIKQILDFLSDVAQNNNRPWFLANKARYDQAKVAFETMVARLIIGIGEFDPSVRHLQPRDCTYRFYRDLRFTQDKSPYKRHLGAYICAMGKKSYHGGYYFHLEPSHCMLAGGCWEIPSKALHALRDTIIGREKEFAGIVEDREFKALFPTITTDPLKQLPRDVPRDMPHPEYVKCRNYVVCSMLPDNFFRTGWTDELLRRCRIMKPFIDFANDVVDDYI